ncbi:unnamed protein product [Staurois parvus]|uniref:Uncharacterized protein n=1 Tax=Staurois parvus TaxID=386267 RepID=A0ABN9G208_9NEOB|nr:unnamed protein product [Staurois parvus]
MTPDIQDRRSGTVLSPSRTGEVGLCRVHTYRIGTDTENDTRHPGQEKWDCAESIHTE